MNSRGMQCCKSKKCVIKNENLEKDKKIVEEQLSRLRSTYENPAERDERIKEILVSLKYFIKASSLAFGKDMPFFKLLVRYSLYSFSS